MLELVRIVRSFDKKLVVIRVRGCIFKSWYFRFVLKATKISYFSKRNYSEIFYFNIISFCNTHNIAKMLFVTTANNNSCTFRPISNNDKSFDCVFYRSL